MGILKDIRSGKRSDFILGSGRNTDGTGAGRFRKP